MTAARRASAALAIACAALGCGADPAAVPAASTTAPRETTGAPSAEAAPASRSAAAPVEPVRAGNASERVDAGPRSGGEPEEPPPAMPASRAEVLLFGAEDAARTATCPAARTRDEQDARVRCLVDLAYDGDARARVAARALFDSAGWVAGLDEAWVMNGGYRGSIEIVPERPVGKEARHLDYVRDAARAIDAFFVELAAHAGGARIPYRWRDLGIRFFRSKHKRTPSAYARGWDVGYNLAGSLNTSPEAVTETLFHEIFHLNDAEHGDWSSHALAPIHAAIVEECGEKTSCLAPYAPNSTVVRGGTYYAFHGGNGPEEYAAELATRYFLEQRARLEGKDFGKRAFKCGPPENAESWAALVSEFFGGVDLVPECPVVGRHRTDQKVTSAFPSAW